MCVSGGGEEGGGGAGGVRYFVLVRAVLPPTSHAKGAREMGHPFSWWGREKSERFVVVAPYWRLVSLFASYGTAEAVP